MNGKLEEGLIRDLTGVDLIFIINILNLLTN